MKPCRIPYENECRTGVRNLSIVVDLVNGIQNVAYLLQRCIFSQWNLADLLNTLKSNRLTKIVPVLHGHNH